MAQVLGFLALTWQIQNLILGPWFWPDPAKPVLDHLSNKPVEIFVFPVKLEEGRSSEEIPC